MKQILIWAVIFSIIGALIVGGCASSAPTPKPTPSPAPSPVPAPSTQVLKLKCSVWTTPALQPGKSMAKWMEMVEQRTNGKVKGEGYYTATLLGGTNTIEGILNGVADVGMNVSSFQPERFPMLALLNYAWAYKHTMVPIKIAWDMYNKFDPPEFKGVKLLSVSCSGVGENGCGFYGRFPITSLADVKGKEIRSTGTGVQALEKLGAAPIFAPVEEIYESLSKNIIKGVYSSFDSIKANKFDEVIQYITPFPAPAAVMYTIAKTETFNSWPADVKKVMEDMKMEHSEWAGALSNSDGLGGFKYAIEKGIKQTTVVPEERAKMLALMKPLADDWLKTTSAKGLPAQAWYDEFWKLLDKYNAQY